MSTSNLLSSKLNAQEINNKMNKKAKKGEDSYLHESKENQNTYKSVQEANHNN